MNAPKHTPGPWKVADDLPGIVETEEHNPRIIAAIGSGVPRSEMDADAHLIAAAPDLLDALRKLRNEIKGQLGIAREEIRQAISTTNLRCLEQRIDEAETAIAKAEGRQ